MAHYTPRGQIIEHLRAKLRDAENQIDDMYRQKKRMVHKMAEDKKTLWHRDTCFSIMYDLLRNEDIPAGIKLWIIKIVVDEQCGEDLWLSEQIVYECYYKGLFR